MCWSRSWPSGSRTRSAPAITERILREAKLDDQVAAAIAAIPTPDGAKLAQEIAELFKQPARRRMARPHRGGGGREEMIRA